MGKKTYFVNRTTREDTVLGDQTYRYLTADEMKSLGDDSLPIDVTRDERIDSNRMISSADSNMLPPQHIEDSISPEHVTQNYVEYIKKYTPDNVDIGRHPISIGFLVSFLVDARGGAMRGCRHSGVRVIVPPRCAPSPTRITCRYVRPQRTPHPPPLMEGEALASRVLELGPVGAKFLGPVIIEVPHFAALRGKEREIVILRSDNGESWKEHTVDATEEVLNEVLHDSFEAEDLNQMEDMSSGRITRIITQDFPQYFAVVSRIRQEVHAIGPEGGMVSSTVVPQVQAVFPEGALTKKIKVGLQAQPIDPELTAKLLGHGVAVSPVVTVEPRRRKFHKAITLSMPAPRAHSQGMINQYSGSAPTLRLLCSITGGTTRAQWEDVTGSTPLTFVNDCVSFTTTVSARFWLMDCRNIGDATKMATELYKEAIHVPFMAKFVVFAKRVDPLEARLRVFCMTDDKEDKTLEQQEHFTEVAKSRDVEVLEGKLQYVEFAGNLVPITKSGEQLSFAFRAFRENRLPFSVRVKDQHAEAVSRCLFMKEPKVPKGEPPQQPICILNIVLPDDIVTDTISLTDTDSLKKHTFLSENFDYYRPDPRLADMSNLLGEDWVPLANQLGLTTSEINVIKSEYPDSVAKQAQSMLRMWLSQSGNKVHTNTLENALRRIGREDIIPQCLNVDHSGQTITKIKQEEIGKYRLKQDIDSIDKDVVREDIVDTMIVADKTKAKKKLESYDKYSAEEKAIEKSDEEEDEDTFDKPVAERREQIEKRLSAERTIPASSQRREIVQEITSIKRQSIVEDKIAEVQLKTIQEPKTTPEQIKVTPPEQKKTTTTTKTTTITPETKTTSDTVEVKTTILSDLSSPEVEQVKTTTTTTTVVTELRTAVPDGITHRTADEAELFEGVSQSLEKTRTPVSKLIADEDPRSPKFSKTPPPSPADFLIREQATTIQDWDASKKPAVTEPKTGVEDAAPQGKTTTTAHYLVSNEDLTLDELPVSDDIFSTRISKPIYDQTNALIQSESRAEPYHPLTDKHYNIQKVEEKDQAKDDKKRKKSILGTIKTFVGKSLDLSDSDSEKSPKKEKKSKKDKKKNKIPGEERPPEIPARPPRKPKLLTPTDDQKYADIPFVEVSPTDTTPSYKAAEITTQELTPYPVSEKEERIKPIHKVSITIPVTDLDDTDSDALNENIKDQAQEIVTGVITDGEEAVKEQLKKSPKPKKQKVVVVDEIVQKTFAPAALEEEEFTIIIDPTRKGSVKKTKETFTLNIDESIDKIEKEILEKSPILPDEKLVKPIAQLEAPIRPPRIRDHVYEDIEEPQETSLTTKDIKIVTNDLIQNEAKLVEQYQKIPSEEKVKSKEDETKEKITDSQKMKRKQGKLFGLFVKPSKDIEESDDDSKKEVIEKHDKETSKEQASRVDVQKSPKLKKSKSKENIDIEQQAEIVEGQKSSKKGKSKEKEDKGFLGLFKKVKKEEEPKLAFSDTVIKDMIESTAFLKEEVDKYHDVRPIIAEPKAEILEEKTKIVQTIPAKVDKIEKAGTEITEIITVPSETLIAKIQVDSEEIVGSKKSFEDKEHIPKGVIKQMQESDLFLNNEVTYYHDVRPIMKPSKPIAESKPSPEKSKKKKKDESKGLFGIFKKKPSEEREIEQKFEKVSDEPVLSEATLDDMKNCDIFLKDEVHWYHDVRPVISIPLVSVPQTESPEKSKKQQKEESKGIFNIFKKKIVDKEIESADNTDLKPLSESTITDIKTSDSFLKDDLYKYHDVQPVFTQETVKIVKISEPVVEKIPEPAVLSENVINEMTQSDMFLKDEVERYYDVRPIVETDSKQAKKSSEKSKKEKSGFFGIFHKASSEEKDVEKKKDIEEITKRMLEADTFLKGEVEKYHDVHPVVLEKPVTMETTAKIPEGIKVETNKTLEEPLSASVIQDMTVTKIFLKDEIEKYHDTRPVGEQTESVQIPEEDKSDSKGFFGLFNKRQSEGKQVERIVDATVVTEQVLDTCQDMADTDTFLKDEVTKYHDVRPVIKPVIEKPVNEPEEKQKSPERTKLQGKGLFGIFKQKIVEKDVEPKVEKTTDILVTSEVVLNDMRDTASFLKDEVEKYHDARPIIKQVSEIEKRAHEEHKTELKGQFKPLQKKSLEENEMEQTESFLKDEIEAFHDVRPTIKQTEITQSPEKYKKHKKEQSKTLFGIFKKKSEEQDVQLVSLSVQGEEVIKNILDTDNFLKDEIDRYHDARPIIQKQVDEIIEESKEKKEYSKGPIGILHKKSEEEIEPVVEKTDETVVITTLPSQDVIKNMLDTDNFLKDEIDQYHDVYPLSKKTVVDTTETSTTTKEHGKGLFGIFKKKSDERNIEPVLEKTEKTSVTTALPSQEVIKNILDTDNFLKDEIDRYQDVRYMAKKPIGEVMENSKEKEGYGKDSFDISKEKSEERHVEPIFQKTEETVVTRALPSQEVINNMLDTDNFLKGEIDRHQDVRPVIQKPKEKTIETSKEGKEHAKGLFDVFKKKSKERDLEPTLQKTNDTVVSSQEVINYMLDTEHFLKDEINRYHDVRPIIQKPVDETIEKPREKKDHGKGLFGIFKKKSHEVGVESPLHKTKETLVSTTLPSQEVIDNMLDTDNFLKGEIDQYYDVRPIIQKSVDETIEKPNERKEHGKGAFGIFKNKSEEKDVEPALEKAEETLVATALHGEKIIQNMLDTNNFLKDEIDRYHDVRPIIQKPMHETIDKSKEQKEYGKGLFGMFKKRSEEGHVDLPLQKTEQTVIITTLPSQEVIKNMIDSDNFLKDEIDRYHDVRPIIQEPLDEIVDKSKEVKEGGILFGAFKKTDDIREKSGIQKTQAVSTLSDQIIKDMLETDSFLKDEIEKYHDVRPIITQTAVVKETTSVQKSPKKHRKEHVKGLFGIFKKKLSEEREIETVIEKSSHQPIFLSENVAKNIIESDSFLKEEVGKYHDVRPVTESLVKPIDGATQSESIKLFGDHKVQVSSESQTERSLLPPEEILQNTDSFLKHEIEVHHDVRPFIKEKSLEMQKSPNKEKKEPVKGLFRIFKKKAEEKDSASKVEKSFEQILQDIQHTDTFLKGEIEQYHDVKLITDKQHIEEEIFEENIQPIVVRSPEEPVLLSENVLRNIIESGSFLKDEVEHYHDVHPVVNETLQSTELQISPKKEKKQSKGIFSIFKKKDDIQPTSEKVEVVLSENIIQAMQESDSFLKEELDKYHDVRPILQEKYISDESKTEPGESKGLFGIFKKKPSEERDIVRTIEKSTKEPVLLSENVVKNMVESDIFLKEEVVKYQDVRPVVQSETEKPIHEKSESGGLFGLFKKKTSEEKEIDGKTTKHNIATTSSEEYIQEMKATDTFLKEEVKLYHDVKPIVQDTITVEVTCTKPQKEKTKEEGKSLFEIFTKKSMEEQETKPDIKEVAASPVLVEAAASELLESDSFLKDEIKLFHDVRPVVKEIIKADSKSSKKSKREKESKGLFGIFKKKPSEEREIESKIEETDTQELCETVLKDMHDTDAFLQDEVEYYHDVRPIVEKTIVEEIKSPEKAKKEKKGGKGLFGIFKKKPSEDREIEHKFEKTEDKLEDSEIVIMQDINSSNLFLNYEREKYYDVRPVIKGTVKDEPKEESSDSSLKDKTQKYHDVRPTLSELKTVEEAENIKKEKGFLDYFKNKPFEDTTSKKESMPSETAIKDMEQSSDFIDGEIERYHDVQPLHETVVKVTGISHIETKDKSQKDADCKIDKTVTEKITTKTNITALEDTSFKKEVERYQEVGPVIKETITITKIQRDKLKDEEDLPDLYETKVSEKLVTGFEKMMGRPTLSGPTVKAMNDSNSFLKAEVERFHDVKTVTSGEGKIEKKGELLGFIKKKASQEREIESKTTKSEEPTISEATIINETIEEATMDRTADKEKPGLFGLFKKKHVDEKDVKLENCRVIPEASLIDIKDVDMFLKDEVNNYQDVRPLISESAAMEKDESAEHSGILGIFRKDKSEQNNEKIDIEEQNIPETTNFLNTELERYEDASYIVEPQTQERKQKIVQKKLPNLSETAVEDIKNTSNFIREEVTHYQDVQTIVQPEIKEIEEKHDKSGKLFGLFSKRRSQDRETSLETEKESGKEKQKKTEKEKKKLKAKDKPKQIGTESSSLDVNDSKDFSKGEVDRHRDSDKVVSPSMTVPQEIEEQPKEKSGFFGLFSKKTKPQETVDESKVTKEAKDEVLKHIAESDDFLKTEIHKFHDVLPQKIPEVELSEGLESMKISKQNIPYLAGSNISEFPVETEEVRLLLDESVPTREMTVIKEMTPMGERVTTIKKEVLVFTDTVQLDPSIFSEVSELEKDIEERLQKVRGEFGDDFRLSTEMEETVFEETPLKKDVSYQIKEIKEVTKLITSEETLPDTMFGTDRTKGFPKQNVQLREDEQPVIKKESAETETEKKYGIFGIFGKRKSQEREISQEKPVDKLQESTVPESPKIKKKSGSPLKIFGKKQSEEEKLQKQTEVQIKPVSFSDEFLKKIEDTHSFLSTEIENYEDGKPQLITDLDEDTEEIKASGLFGIFNKKEKVSSPKAPKRKLKKQKSGKSTDEIGFIEKIGRKFTTVVDDKVNEIKPDVADTLTSGEDVITIAENITYDTIQRAKEIADTTEQDAKIVSKKVSFTGIKDDITSIPTKITEGIKETGGEFSENVEQDVRKLGSKEDSVGVGAESEMVKFKEEIDTLLEGGKQKSSDIMQTLDQISFQTIETLENVQSDIKDTSQKLSKDVDTAKQMSKTTVDAATDSAKQATQSVMKGVDNETEKVFKKTSGFFTKLGERMGSKGECIKNDAKVIKEEAKEAADGLAKQTSESFGKQMKEAIFETSQLKKSELVDHPEKKDKKMKKSFFSRLSEKIGGKGDEVAKEIQKEVTAFKTESEQIADETNKKLQDIKTNVQDIRKSVTSEISLDERAVKEETSSFVTDILQSFDNTLEHVKEEGLETKDVLNESKDQLSEITNDITHSASSKLADIEDKNISETQKMKVHQTERITNIEVTSKKVENKSFRKVDEQFSDTIKLGEQMALDVQQKVKDDFSTSNQFLEGERKSIERNMQVMGTGITTSFKDTTESIKKIGVDASDAMTCEIDQARNQILIIGQEGEFEPREKLRTNFHTDVKDKIQDISTELKNISVTTADTAEEPITEAEESIKHSAQDLKQCPSNVGNISAGFFSKLTDKLSAKSKDIEKSVKDVETKIENQISTTKEDIQLKHDMNIQPSKTTTKESKEDIQDYSAKLIAENKVSLQDFVGKSGTAITDVMDDLKYKTQKKMNESKSTVSKTVEAAEAGVIKLTDDVKDTTVESMEESRDFLVKLEDYISSKTKETDEKVDEVIEHTDKGKQKVEADVAIAVQNVEHAAETVEKAEDSVLESRNVLIEAVSDTREKLLKTAEKTVVDSKKLLEDVEGHIGATEDKISKKGKPKFLGKLGKRFSGKGDEFRGKSEDESPKEVEYQKKDKKSGGFFSKLGDKITGKTEGEKQKIEKENEQASGTLFKGIPSVLQKVTTDPELDVKKKTLDFIESESLIPGDTSMTRTTSDYGNVVKEIEGDTQRRISEANIDLSNLPTNVDEYVSKKEKRTSSYVTSPTLARRAISQRFPKGERPEVVEVRNLEADDISDDEFYIVTDPEEIITEVKEEHRRPLFHIASEDDENTDQISEGTDTSRQDKSNVTEKKIDGLISDLTREMSEQLEIKKVEIKKKERKLEERKKESQAEVDMIEKKLRDLDKALDSLEQIDSQIQQGESSSELDKKTDKKLKRVERKFERMASEVIDKDTKEAKQKLMTSPEIEEKRETEFKQLVSQLSTEEISDFQREYGHLWDEHTFSKSDEWDSKTPESQADAQELPQGRDEATTSVAKELPPPVRAEGEEAEKEEGGSERKVADQHQLSEEMKELLRELEKESKQ